MKVLTADQMREVDRLTTEAFKMPGLLLMERAAASVVEAIERGFAPLVGKSVLVVCGRGNNGGDGAAVARLLREKVDSVDLLLLGRAADARGDARTNFEIARTLAAEGGRLRLVEIDSLDNLRQEFDARAHDLIIDAIFGTGLSRPATGIFEEAINLINRRSAGSSIVAVDIPSGLAADSPQLIGPAVRAHLTVTFTAPKIASVLPPASDYSGALRVAMIGSPDELVTSSGSRLTLTERDTIAHWLVRSRRSPHANKGSVGRVLIVAGSRGKTGAAALAGEAALRAGAGLVTVASAESVQPVIASLVTPECMTESLAETTAGTVAREAADKIFELAGARDVVAVGPGLGSGQESTRELVRALVVKRERPTVIDADGLNSLAPWPEELRGTKEAPLILTPHPGEMSRLIDKQVPEVLERGVEVARDLARSRELIVVLKGSRTLIAAPDGEVYINPTGNAGMATGGTGDVLTGIIAAFVAQGPDDPVAAVRAAVYLHGLAGDRAASLVGTRAMIASDISRHLGEAFIEIGGDDERFRRRDAV
ncbi:MAG TPA: NAD(P)H-hydrate dehydratase [Blastocatellia bacterium]|nr:NAD(P)H-hydrate dehydratase [Blastocatellia bacterium]